MDLANYFKSIMKGVIWSIVITVIASIIFAILMNSITIGENIFNIIYVVISCLALILGSVIAVKAYGSKGWIVGLTVGCRSYINNL